MAKSIIYIDSATPGTALDSGLTITGTDLVTTSAFTAASVTTTGNITASGAVECASITVDGEPIKNSLFALYTNQQTSGTDGGTATQGSWLAQPLNTEVYCNIVDMELAKVSANYVTFPAGVYKVLTISPFYDCGIVGVGLYDKTTPTTIGTLAGGVCTSGGGVNVIYEAKFSVASEVEIRLSYQVETTKTTTGLGLATSFGTEQYAQMFIEQLYPL